MKRFQIFALLSVIAICILIQGCSEEKTYNIESGIRKNVRFTVENITVGQGDSAVSTKFDYGFYDEWLDTEHRKTFKIPVYYYDDETGKVDTSSEPRNYEYQLQYYGVWAAGNNELKITFHPSCREEKSMTLTLPTGNTVELTADSPEYVWMLNAEHFHQSYGVDGYSNLVKIGMFAKSEYQKDGITYQNIGYVLIFIGDYGLVLAYEPEYKVWTNYSWTNVPY